MSIVEPAGRPVDRLPVRFIVGVAVPLAVASLSYVLWWISDRLLYVGPLDRAAFGWLVVIPLWVAAPVAGGFAWRRLTPGMTVLAAVFVGTTISAAAAFQFWQAVAYPNCEFGEIRTPGDWVLPSLMLGLVIGGGLTISGLCASVLVREGRRWRAVVFGAGAEVVMVFAAILVAGVVLMGPNCQRPPLPV